MDEENAVLAEIRAVNDSIEDAALSAQIAPASGLITCPRIFEYQKSHPERSAQLHAFLSYYLPTTLKILRAYAQLESQGVEGENIAAAMSRIEGMMGKVVEGFEKQLDQLFQGDAMDITTDVAGSGADAPEGWTVLLRRDADWNLTDSKAAGIFPRPSRFFFYPTEQLGQADEDEKAPKELSEQVHVQGCGGP